MGKTKNNLEQTFLTQLVQQQEILYYAWYGAPTQCDTIPSIESYQMLFDNSDVLDPLIVDWEFLAHDETKLFMYLNEIIFVIQEQMIFWRLNPKSIYNVVYVTMDNYMRMMNDLRSWKFGNKEIYMVQPIQEWRI